MPHKWGFTSFLLCLPPPAESQRTAATAPCHRTFQSHPSPETRIWGWRFVCCHTRDATVPQCHTPLSPWPPPAPRGASRGSECTLGVPGGALTMDVALGDMVVALAMLGSMVLGSFSNLNNSITHLTKHSKLTSKYVQRYTMNCKGLNVISDELNSTPSQDILVTYTPQRFACSSEKWGILDSSCLSSSPYQGHWTKAPPTCTAKHIQTHPRLGFAACSFSGSLWPTETPRIYQLKAWEVNPDASMGP